METFITIIGICGIVLIVYLATFGHDKKVKKQKEKNNIRQKEQNVILEKQVIHLGGHPYLNSNDSIYLQIRNNNNLYCYKKDTNTGNEIPLNSISKYEIRSEEQIQKDITFGRFVMFGLASLALQKKSKITNEYLLISYTQNKVDINCLFKSENNNLGDFVSALNRLKIQENNG